MIRGEILALAVGVAVLIALVVVAVVFLPGLASATVAFFAPGVGLKTAALVSVALSLVVVIVLALTAGDGLIGEIQYMIAAFFIFFLFFTVMIAWIF